MTAVTCRLRFGPRPESRWPRAWRDDTVAVWADFRDVLTAAPAEVSGVTARVWLPGGALLDPAPVPVREAIGVWRIDLLAAYAGTWRVEIRCAAPDRAIDVAQFVVEAPEPGPAPPPPQGAVTSVNGLPGPAPVLAAPHIAFIQADPGAVVRSVGDELRERVSHAQFLGAGRTPGQAIAAAIDYIWRNNGDDGGEVVLPPGPPIVIDAPIEARPGVTVRGRRLLRVTSWPHGVQRGVFDVNGQHGFGLVDLAFNTDSRASPVFVTGGATDFFARGLRLLNARGVFLQRCSRVRISDLYVSGGRFGLGTGYDLDAAVSDVIIQGMQCYDTTSEAMDLNANTRGLVLDGFHFVNGSAADNEEVVDIGGGYCEDIILANGVVDCGGRGITGIKAKLATRNLRIIGVDVRNGDPGNPVCYGINLEESYNTEIRATTIDGTFARGIFLEPAARRVSADLPRCDSPIFVNGGEDHDIRFHHDGGGTASTSAAIKIDFGALRVRCGGRIRGRPNTDGVQILGASLDCGVEDLEVVGGLRAVNIGTGANGTWVRRLRARDFARFAVATGPGVLRLHVDGVEAVDGSTLTPGAEAAVQVNSGCDGARIYRVLARDTRAGAARTQGRPVRFVGAATDVHYDGIVSQNLATPGVLVGGGMTNLTAGTDLTWT